jgi:DNA polymerase I-like protein with 3'-5' exonuclease and polymerase domains
VIVNADFKALEWVCAVYLSKDEVGYREILDGVDQHAQNIVLLNLPHRDVAKRFVFRLIYGGGAYSYANDPMFKEVSQSEEFWQEVIDKWYGKYHGVHSWHEGLVMEAMSTGRVAIPTGRVFTFQPENGKWPRTQILNYPVQGLGADLMVIARNLLWRELRDRPGVLFVCTVHDSIVLDVEDHLVPEVAQIIYKVWKAIPTEFEKWFGLPFDLPCKVEVTAGHDWKNQQEIKEC